MKLNRLRGKIRREARRGRRNGSMDRSDYDACMEIIKPKNAANLAKLNAQIETKVNPWKRADGLVGADWREWLANAWDWFKENWPEILAFIMKLAPLLLILEPAREDS